MRILVPLTLLLASACGLDEARFVSRQAEQDCAYALACFSDPMLAFQGWTDQETCESTHGPTLAAVAASCDEFDNKAAKECIKAMKGRACAGEGPSLDRPAVCDVVFSSCEAGDT
jgi:hypothetical protein